jgi:hypothetical protein
MKIETIIRIVCASPTVLELLTKEPQYKGMTSAQLHEAALIGLADMRQEDADNTAKMVAAAEEIAKKIWDSGYAHAIAIKTMGGAQ